VLAAGACCRFTAGVIFAVWPVLLREMFGSKHFGINFSCAPTVTATIIAFAFARFTPAPLRNSSQLAAVILLDRRDLARTHARTRIRAQECEDSIFALQPSGS
jgi:hypothetical protein